MIGTALGIHRQAAACKPIARTQHARPTVFGITAVAAQAVAPVLPIPLHPAPPVRGLCRPCAPRSRTNYPHPQHATAPGGVVNAPVCRPANDIKPYM